MQLGRYSVSTLRPPPIHSITFSEDGRFFSIAGEQGYEVWKSWPLSLVKRRILPGTLALALLLPNSPLLVLQGGGANPLYSPNKAVIYNDKLGVAVAEVEFGERIKGIKARNGLICVALSRKVIAFEYGVGPADEHEKAQGTGRGKGKGKLVDAKRENGDGFWLNKFGEWETALNDAGLVALSTSPGSSLLALPGRQSGHVQLISLPPCPPLPSSSSSSHSKAIRSPIILAHTHPLSTLSITSNGSHLITTSERGTLLRIWDTSRGRLERELRRGVDRAEMWGCQFETTTSSIDNGTNNTSGKSRVVGWSDKGTIHVWKDEDSGGNTSTRSSTPTPSSSSLTHLLSRNLPLPKYFSSSPSIAQYHLPRKNPHAISSALGKAGVNVPSMKNEDTDNEQSEMFIVGWIDVEIPLSFDESRLSKDEIKVGKRISGLSTEGGISSTGIGMGMGGREERRSFGSDNTSRTATPPLLRNNSGNRTGQNPTSAVPSSVGGRRGSIARSVSNNFINKSSVQDQPTPTSIGTNKPKGHAHITSLPKQPSIPLQKTRIEKQLIVITYSGDWYRLRIPDSRRVDNEDEIEGGGGGKEGEESKGIGHKCELVEYRRLGVSGGGW